MTYMALYCLSMLIHSMRLLICSTLLIILCSSLPARGMITFPAPYILVSHDEAKVLVMQTDLSKYNMGDYDATIRMSNGMVLRPMKDFPHSGVYSLPDKKLIYGVDWYIQEQGILTSADFEHIMCQNRHGANDTWALAFYARGKMVKNYTSDELLTVFKSEWFLPFSTTDFHYPWCQKTELIVNRVVVQTSDRTIAGFNIGYSEVYEFDITTGEMRSKDVRNTGFIALGVALLGFLGILAAVVARYVKKRMPN